ncbi:hypothetical protein LSAT2_029163 [Lamellibrachia satsuma]|nr:hypothetical protein LSAT2_029163 [Lamellibrachia satsuma]
MYVHRGSKGCSPRYDIFGPTDSRESYEEIYPIISYGQTRVTIQTDHSCSVGHRSRDSQLSNDAFVVSSNSYRSKRWSLFARRKPDVMVKFVIALLVLVAVYAAEAAPSHGHKGCFNGYDYDCCRNRRPNFCYPSLSKPCPYYYKCVGRRVVYGRCAVNQCVTMSGSCGSCSDRCSYTSKFHYYYSSVCYGRYYYGCNRGAMYYRSCGLNQSFYPSLGRCGCRESYCERYSGWQSTVCNGCDATTTADVVVVSAGATNAVAGDKQTVKSGVH